MYKEREEEQKEEKEKRRRRQRDSEHVSTLQCWFQQLMPWSALAHFNVVSSN